MTQFAAMSREELAACKAQLEIDYAAFQAKNLSLNMARGKPSSEQLNLSTPLLSILSDPAECIAEDGTDCRNYGVVDGLPEAKRLMAAMLDDDPDNVVVGGNSSLTMMHDALAWCIDYGTGGCEPWLTLDTVKWLCPCPGYDRHFRITETFGMELVPVPQTEDGPDMDVVERLVANDASVKGIWCVPKYANPTGCTYSDETVRRLASMPCAASDFRIFWDNAYSIHHLFDEASQQDHLLDIGTACKEAGNPQRYFKFASTSKVTLPGAGIAAFAASPANVAEFKKHLGVTTVGPDKLNQLRHVRFLKDAEGLAAHMRKHAAILRPKFALVEQKLSDGLRDIGGCTWSNPRGGYFVSFDAPNGCATRIVELARQAGVVMTGAGATWPYGRDPHDSNIRIAPTLPPLAELGEALDVFVCCVKLAYAEKLLG